MTEKFQFSIPEIPQELHSKLWEAQDAYDAKVTHIGRLESAKAALEAEIVTMKSERETAKAQYLEGFEGIEQGSKEFAEAAKNASSLVVELSNKIAGHQEALADYEKQIWPAKNSLRNHADEVDRARNQILRFLLSHVPSQIMERPRKHSLIEHIADNEELDLSQLLIMFMAREVYGFSTNGRYGLRANGFGAGSFFEFVGKFFGMVSDDEAITLKAKLDQLIWGDREPAPVIRLPRQP